MRTAHFLMVDPAHYEVAYTINPWMAPGAWQADPIAWREAACAASRGLATALRGIGARVETMPGVAGAPDLVFPANAAVVLDRRAILARFLHAERQVEEPVFRRAFAVLREQDLLDEVAELPQGIAQEGAGDFIWDAARALFWAGYGPRSDRAGTAGVAAFFGCETVALELATRRFYHLDTCFCPLPGGEIFYYPPAFTPASQRIIESRVAASDLIEAGDEDAARFCVNAVAVESDIVMARAADALRGKLEERGYRLHEIDLTPFMLSGGGAYCMTLRLDRLSTGASRLAFREAAE